MEAKKKSSFKMVQLVNSSIYFKESEKENGGSPPDLGSRGLLGPVMAGGCAGKQGACTGAGPHLLMSPTMLGEKLQCSIQPVSDGHWLIRKVGANAHILTQLIT